MKSEVERILAGDQLAGARLIRLLEDREPGGVELLKELYPRAGQAFLIGVTGPAAWAGCWPSGKDGFGIRRLL